MGIVPNRSGSRQGVLQALWRNLFRSNPFHFGSADEADGGSTFQGGGKTRPSGWSVFAYQALKRRRSELAQTLLIGRWRPMSSFDKSQTKKKKKRKTTAKKVAMITTKTTTATRFENYPFLTP